MGGSAASGQTSIVCMGAAMVCGLAVCIAASPQRSREHGVRGERSVTRTFRFGAVSPGTLDLRNVHGSIRVIGHDGTDVELVATRRVSADAEADLHDAEREVALEMNEGGSTVLVRVVERGSPVCGEQWEGGPTNWGRRPYLVTYDFTVRVPRATRLRLCTIDAGDVSVDGTSGEFDIDSVGGRIAMRNVRGAGDAETVNGSVTVSFAEAPSAASLFKTINGDVTVTLPRSLAADVRMTTFNGQLYTDFDGPGMPPQASAPHDGRPGRRSLRAARLMNIRVGGGGPELTFDAFNGSVRVLGAGR